MHTTRKLSIILASALNAHRCGFASDGSHVFSLLPLHGLDQGWKAVVNTEEEYNAVFPGYLTSKNGPQMTEDHLKDIQSMITSRTGIMKPYKVSFDGDVSDHNIFARIIRGELPHWRIWENESHVAFLTTFANTPGFTVLVPRKHLSSDIFRLEETDFTGIVEAAYVVAQYLKQAFNVTRCGMFFEGFEIDYAHVKLIPIQNQSGPEAQLSTPIASPTAFQETYPGFLTTQVGPPASDLDAIADEATHLREQYHKNHRIKPPKTWRQPGTHCLQALQSPWYEALFSLQTSLFTRLPLSFVIV